MPTCPEHDEPAATASDVVALSRLRLRYAEGAVDVRLRYRLTGTPGMPVVAVLGGISANADVTVRDDGSPGWWAGQVGRGLGVDTRRYRVLSFDYLIRDDFKTLERRPTCRPLPPSRGKAGMGGCPEPARFSPSSPQAPSVEEEGESVLTGVDAISTADQAAVLAALLVELDINRLHALIGASYGAMVGLAFAESHPELLQRLVAISGAHCAHPFATALRGLQRKIIRSGNADESSLVLARALALTTYLTPEYFAERFTAQPVADVDGFHAEVLSYLLHHGKKYAEHADARHYLDLSESLDLHSVEPERIDTPATLIAADPDSIVPTSQMRELAGRLAGPVHLHVVDSVHGHDAFLKEHAAFRPLLRQALEGDHRHVA